MATTTLRYCKFYVIVNCFIFKSLEFPTIPALGRIIKLTCVYKIYTALSVPVLRLSLQLSMVFNMMPGIVKPLAVLFILPRIALFICVILCFHVNFNIILLFYEECHWNFHGGRLKSLRYFLQCNHFHIVNFANPKAWTVFPASCFFNFFFQCQKKFSL